MMENDIEITEIKDKQFSLFPGMEVDRLTVLWNKGPSQEFAIDDETIKINTNCILFISEFYMELNAEITNLNILSFDKTFLSPINSMNHVGEYLMLFYGSHAVNGVPKITLRENEIEMFNSIWDNMVEETMNSKNPISAALLRNSFSRFLLMSQQIHMETEFDIPIDFKDLKIIREFQYLVNNNFKELTKVSDYAKILMISPKKISEIFGCCYNKKASELIADRRNLFAKRQLSFTNELVKNIAYDLNFSDSQTFSHFFKKQNGITPDEYRKSNSVSI
ncbi:MAG: helix-turn-helix domain-containing protein [Flavobacteriales bacterium]